MSLLPFAKLIVPYLRCMYRTKGCCKAIEIAFAGMRSLDSADFGRAVDKARQAPGSPGPGGLFP